MDSNETEIIFILAVLVAGSGVMPVSGENSSDCTNKTAGSVSTGDNHAVIDSLIA